MHQVLHYVFGIVGMWVLAGKVSALEGSELPLHFDNMLDAQRSLTAQLLDSSNWADLLNMAIEATGGLGISFYFIFYASLMQILFTSILISLVVEGYQVCVLTCMLVRVVGWLVADLLSASSALSWLLCAGPAKCGHKERDSAQEHAASSTA